MKQKERRERERESEREREREIKCLSKCDLIRIDFINC